MYGDIESGWELKDNLTIMHVAIPANTTSRVFIPASSADKVKEGGKALSSQEGIKIAGAKDGYVELHLGSGNYTFEIAK